MLLSFDLSYNVECIKMIISTFVLDLLVAVLCTSRGTSSGFHEQVFMACRTKDYDYSISDVT